MPELLSFLLNILYNEEGQALISQSRQLQDVVIQCLIHQVLLWFIILVRPTHCNFHVSVDESMTHTVDDIVYDSFHFTIYSSYL